MNNQELIEYLKMVLDVEQTIYTRDELIKKLNNDLINLEPTQPVYHKPRNLNNPNPKYDRDYKKLKELEKEIANLEAELKEWTNTPVTFTDKWFGNNKNKNKIEEKIKSIEIRLDDARKDYKKYQKKYNYSLKTYERKKREYEKFRGEFEKEKEEFVQKNKNYILVQKPYIKKQIQELKRAQNESLDNLKVLYNQGFIYPRYRNIIAVAAILEYLESGRCSSLDGDYGAYNKFDMEFNFSQIIQNQNKQISLLRQLIDTNNQIVNQIYQLEKVVKESQARIVTSLHSISTSMNEIIDNQHRLNSDVNQGMKNIVNNQDQINKSIDSQNKRLDNRTNILKQIKVNSDITAYNQEHSRKELEYLRRMDDLEKGRWWNY